jgi:hypothetical protein
MRTPTPTCAYVVTFFLAFVVCVSAEVANAGSAAGLSVPEQIEKELEVKP